MVVLSWCIASGRCVIWTRSSAGCLCVCVISSLTFLHTCCFLCVFILSIFPALDCSPRFLVMPRAVSISRSCVCRCQSSSALSCFAIHCMFSLYEPTGWYPTLDWTKYCMPDHLGTLLDAATLITSTVTLDQMLTVCWELLGHQRTREFWASPRVKSLLLLLPAAVRGMFCT